MLNRYFRESDYKYKIFKIDFFFKIYKMEDTKYQQGKIYKIVCNITNEIYIGSTIKTLNDRLCLHRLDKHCVSRNIIERGDYKIELIKNYPCNSKYELEEEEAQYIRNNTCINTQIPHRTDKQYREDNKEKLSQQQKNWIENNKTAHLQQRKKYREDNKEVIRKKQLEKIKCECGALISRSNISIHKKTLKHLKLTECLIID